MDGAVDIKWAGEPFDKSDGDIILCTSDHVCFSVYMVVLSLTSGFFEGMAKVPQPSDAGKRPIIDVQENSETLDALLRYMYPGDGPVLNDIMRIGEVLRAAVKYDVDPVVQRLKRQLSMFDDPKRVFTVACLADLESEPYQAAVEWCQDPSYDLEDTYVKDMDKVSAGTYHRLLYFCDAYKRKIELPQNYRFTCPASRPLEEPAAAFTVPSPFDQPSSHANIVIRSREKFNFYAMESLIAIASTKLEQLIRDARTSDIKPQEDYPILALPEPAEVLLPLLQLTYPGPTPHIHNWELLTAVLETAHKYELVRAAELAKRAWMNEIEAQPLRSYFVAVRQGWHAEARLAAKHALLIPTDTYCVEMETVPAGCYDRFLRYRQRCRRSVIDGRRAFMEDEYLTDNFGQREVYDVFWCAESVEGMLHYRLHEIWARAGVVSPGLFALWSPVGLGGHWPAHMQQFLKLLDMWGGRNFRELLENYDRCGGQAMEAVDQIDLQV